MPSQEPYSYTVPGGGDSPPRATVTGWRPPLCLISLLQEQKHLHEALHNTGMAPAGAGCQGGRLHPGTCGLLQLPEPWQGTRLSPRSPAVGTGASPGDILSWFPPLRHPPRGWLRCSVAQGWPAVPGIPSGPGSCGSRGVSGSRGGLCPSHSGAGVCGPGTKGAPQASAQRLPCRGAGGLEGRRERLSWRLDAGVQDSRSKANLVPYPFLE